MPRGNTLDEMYGVPGAEAGQHHHRQIGGYQVHGQVLPTPWVAPTLPLGSAFLATRSLRTVPSAGQNIIEYVIEFARDSARTQTGEEEYRPRVPSVGTPFLSIFVPNRSGAPIPRRILELPHGESAAPTNDINTTVALALLTSAAYFYAGPGARGISYFGRYVRPTPILLPINILEDFTKPPSLSFRLSGNTLADELVVAAPISPVPPIVPIPTILLGLFTSAIQASIFATLAAAHAGESLEVH